MAEIKRDSDGKYLKCGRFVCKTFHNDFQELNYVLDKEDSRQGSVFYDGFDDGKDLDLEFGMDSGYDPFKGEVISGR